MRNNWKAKQRARARRERQQAEAWQTRISDSERAFARLHVSMLALQTALSSAGFVARLQTVAADWAAQMAAVVPVANPWTEEYHRAQAEEEYRRVQAEAVQQMLSS